MGVWETLMPDAVAPEVHQNDCSYVHELSGPTFDSLCNNLASQAVIQRTSKNHKTVKIGGWALTQGLGAYPDNTVK